MNAARTAALLALLCGCTQVTVAVPYDREVRLLRADESASVRRQYRAWFALWGLVRVSGKDTADVIRDEDLCEVRVRVEDNVPDAIIGFTYTVIEPIGIIPQSIVVEGNRGACERRVNHSSLIPRERVIRSAP